MNIDASTLTAISGLITGLLGIVIAGATARSSASKAELASLRDTINLLMAENVRLRKRIEELELGVDAKNDRIRELETANESKDAKIAGMECEIKELTGRLDRLSSRRRGGDKSNG